MSKGILNNRDKFVWDNTHKPEITDVVGVVDDEMDDLLDDHDDKVVDIVGDNMNDLLDAHDDKVVSIVGDNMVTLLNGAASTVQLIAGDLSGVGTSEAVKVGTWDATHDIYAKKYTGTLPTTESATTHTFEPAVPGAMFDVKGTLSYGGATFPLLDGVYRNSYNSWFVYTIDNTSSGVISYTQNLSEASYSIIVYYIVATE